MTDNRTAESGNEDRGIEDSSVEDQPIEKNDTGETNIVSSTLSRVKRQGQGSTADVKQSKRPAVKSAASSASRDEKKRERSRQKELQASKKQERAAKQAEDREEESEWPTWARVIFFLFRKSIVPVIMIAMLLAGLYAGYVFLGDGPKDDVFKWETWRHMYDLVFASS